MWQIRQQIIDRLFTRHTTQFYQKGSLIFAEGSPADVAYWIKRGIVELYRTDKPDRRLIVRLAGPGEIIGLDETDEDGETLQSFGARARLTSEVVMITREHITRVLNSLDSSSLTKLILEMNKAWSEHSLRWTEFALLTCRERLSHLLIDLARRFGTADKRGILVVLEFTHQDLADMVGFSRAMVTRVMSDFLNEGLLLSDNGHYLLPSKSDLALAV
jgi:CRP/FNR family cyclic AMP-dependent transcriptional regulator